MLEGLTKVGKAFFPAEKARRGPSVRVPGRGAPDLMVRAANGNPFLLYSPTPRMQLGTYRKRELRFRALANTDPAEAERLPDLAQPTVRQRWQIYQGTATHSAGDLPVNARKNH